MPYLVKGTAAILRRYGQIEEVVRGVRMMGRTPGTSNLRRVDGPSTSAGDEHASPDAPPELLRLRDSIDNLDAALVHLLSERFKLTRAVGEFKAGHALPPSDKGREARQIARLRALSEQAQLDPAIAEKFLVFIISEVVRHHEAIAERHQKGHLES